MTDRILYTSVLPVDGMSSERTENRSDVSEAATINADYGSSIASGSQPSNTPLEGVQRGLYADGLAQELGELAANTTIKAVPLYGKESQIASAGYYTVQMGQADEVDPRTDNIQSYRVALSKVGTHGSHYRGVYCELADATTPYGTADTAPIAVPSSAKQVRWWNEQTGAESAASSVAQTTTEHGTINVYDAHNAGMATPTLLYRLPYDAEGYQDARLYDDRGEAHTTDGYRAWDRVFVSKHDYRGAAVLDNSKIRVTVDEAGETMSWRRYEGGAWTDQSLNTSDWTFNEVAVTHIGACRVETQLRFENSSSGTFYRLNASLRRGLDGLVFFEAANADTIPTGLKDKLAPLAYANFDRDAQPIRVTVPRQEVAD